MYKTKSSFHNPLVFAPPRLFPTSNYKEKECLAFYISQMYRLYIRTQFGLVMRRALVHFPMQTVQSSIASTHGGFSREALRK